ncbi:hypothetical protein CTI12_AA222480 [Artemisia annua]|uniref:Uncharacterized protein n=1 Tax=Artemisia annua TaxID=35608 RepID=A0A2U1NU91_ARTAN|nr:hypothetical protein CTI12_AA222480 [Artemisia annua]
MTVIGGGVILETLKTAVDVNRVILCAAESVCIIFVFIPKSMGYNGFQPGIIVLGVGNSVHSGSNAGTKRMGKFDLMMVNSIMVSVLSHA